MRQFTVPQFIDIEDKILGPVTTRQFLISMVGFFLVFIEYRIADFTLFLFMSVITAAITGVIAYVRVNGQPFHFFLLNLLQTVGRPALRVWSRDVQTASLKPMGSRSSREPSPYQDRHMMHIPLSQLAMLIDTGGLYKPEGDEA